MEKINLSKNLLEKDKKIQNQSASALSEYKAQQAEKQAKKDALIHEQNLKAASMAATSSYTRGKNRVNSLLEKINYTQNASKYGMAALLEEVVNKSLMLDEEEYTKLNPNYKNEIKELISSFLEDARLNKDIKDQRTLNLMEYVSKILPTVETGKYLTEANIFSLIKEDPTAKINADIDSLSNDVKTSVANIVAEEQSRIGNINREVNDVSNISEEAKAKNNIKTNEQKAEENKANQDELVAQIKQGIANGELKKDEIKKAIKDGQLPSQALEIFDQISAEMKESNPKAVTIADNAPDNGEFSVPAEGEEELPTAAQVAPGNRKVTQINISPKGDVQLTIQESPKFVRENKRQGLIESLACNEAVQIVKEGKEYNSDLALANAITYVTVLETFKVSGLLDINKSDYNRIIREAGGLSY